MSLQRLLNQATKPLSSRLFSPLPLLPDSFRPAE